jgi:hypothetical protein
VGDPRLIIDPNWHPTSANAPIPLARLQEVFLSACSGIVETLVRAKQRGVVVQLIAARL